MVGIRARFAWEVVCEAGGVAGAYADSHDELAEEQSMLLDFAKAGEGVPSSSFRRTGAGRARWIIYCQTTSVSAAHATL